jgi:hypothetical protein
MKITPAWEPGEAVEIAYRCGGCPMRCSLPPHAHAANMVPTRCLYGVKSGIQRWRIIDNEPEGTPPEPEVGE